MPKTSTLAALALLALLPLGCATPAAGPRASVNPVPAVMHAVQDEAQPGDSFDDTAARKAAAALLASLDDAQRGKIAFAIDSETRTDWHFIPRDRVGLPLGELTDAQKHHVHALLLTALSNAGYLKVTDILWLETFLAEFENNPRGRDVGKYVVQIFGDPSADKAAWGWRFEGHHLSVNLLYADGQVRVTPMFLGTNPAVVPTGPLAGKRILSEEHTLALELAASMSAVQREKMMLQGKPRDIITSPGREQALFEVVGIPVSEFDTAQREKFVFLLAAYTGSLRQDHQLHYLEMIQDAGLIDQFLNPSFAWAGPTDGSGPFYYRIHSPNFLIEYSCQGANHVHAVFHDLTDPLGKDLLREHFEQHEHQ